MDDDGRVFEQGTYRTLIQAGGLYRHMWDEQQMVQAWKCKPELVGSAMAIETGN